MATLVFKTSFHNGVMTSVLLALTASVKMIIVFVLYLPVLIFDPTSSSIISIYPILLLLLIVLVLVSFKLLVRNITSLASKSLATEFVSILLANKHQAKFKSNIKKCTFLGVVSHLTHNIKWYNCNTNHIDTISYICFNEGMNDLCFNATPLNSQDF